MKIRTSNQQGFTLVEIMIVVAIIGMLAAIAIPNFVKARTTAQTNACINNLRLIESAIQEWATEQKKADTAAVTFQDISSYMKNSITCPAGGSSFADSYQITTVAERPKCLKNPEKHKLPDDTLN
jgi:prepilin-type N-terminal cleavage/methylation domain-containing protein